MPILYQLRAFVGGIPRASVRKQLKAFRTATVDCRGEQERVLQELLALNGDSRFSNERGLNSVKTPAEFRNAVPITRYDDYAPYIEDLKRGDHQALLGSGNRLLMFSLSSGTTSTSKFIPITQRFLDDYRRGWQIWGISTFDDHPAINSRNIVQLSSDDDRFRTPGGTPCGNISGLVASMQKRIVQTMYTVPGTVAKIKTPEVKSYTTLRLALADEHVGLAMTANPSTLIHLAKIAEENAESLIRDIHDGSLAVAGDVPDEVRHALRKRLNKRRPKRARFLENLIESTGRLRPMDYWQRMVAVAVWTGGSAGAYLHSLKEHYGDVAIRDHGLSASEGRMTIPLEAGADGVLDVTSHYFEFIPEEEYESEHPTVLEAHELEVGRNYFILLTTPSGFCRYDICDVVRCTGYENTTPKLVFLHKGAHISNVTGEKVSESQVVEAVKECVSQMSVPLKHFTVTPVWDEPPRYQLIAEQRDFSSSDLIEKFLRGVDTQLQTINCEYREKRNTGRLGDMTFFPLPDDTWTRFTRKRQATLGGSLEQYKHPCLVPDLKFSDQLVGEFES